jgi:hypothetical protein
VASSVYLQAPRNVTPPITLCSRSVASRAAVFYACYCIIYSALTDLLHRSSIVFLFLFTGSTWTQEAEPVRNCLRSWPRLPSVEKTSPDRLFFLLNLQASDHKTDHKNIQPESEQTIQSLSTVLNSRMLISCHSPVTLPTGCYTTSTKDTALTRICAVDTR